MIRIDSAIGVLEDGTERGFANGRPGMIGNYRPAFGVTIVPYLVTAGGVPVKHEAGPS